MIINRMLSLTTFLIMSFSMASGQNLSDNLSISIIRTADNDFSTNFITGIFQDSSGFMWFGSHEGLFRFDGFEILQKGNDPSSSAGRISEQFISNIIPIDRNRFAVATGGGGVTVFSALTGLSEIIISDTSHYYKLSDNKVAGLTKDKKGNLWIGTVNGLNKLNLNEKSNTIYYADDQADGLVDNKILSLLTDANNNIWIGTTKGLCIYYSALNKFVRVRLPVDKLRIQALAEWGNQVVIGTENGVYSCRIDDPGIIEAIVKHDPVSPGFFSEYNTNSLLVDRKRRLWTATGKGIFIVSSESGKRVAVDQHVDGKNLNSIPFTKMLEDEEGNIWLGTNSNGVFFVKNNLNIFNRVKLSESGIGVQHLFTDVNDDIYASSNNGLLKLDKNLKLQHDFKSGDKIFNSLTIGVTKGFEDSLLFINLYDRGLVLYNSVSRKIIREFNSNRADGILFGHKISKLFSSGDTLWFTSNYGLFKLYRRDNNFSLTKIDLPDLLSDNNFFSALYVDDRDVWVGHGILGAYQVNRTTGKIRYYHKESIDKETALLSNNIEYIMKRRNGDVWLGTTAAGIAVISENGQVITFLTNTSGLVSNNIKAMQEDNQQRIWITSNLGLMVYFDETGIQSFSKQETFSGDFTPASAVISDNGRIIFGRSDGILSIRSGDFIPDYTKIKPLISSIEINNNKINISQQEKQLTINPDDKIISFILSSTQFVNVNQLRFAYKLEGLSNKWTEIGKRRIVTFTNLDPGDYTFKVKVSNVYGLWSESQSNLNFTVKPIFWKTWWFISLVILLALSAITAIVYFRITKIIAIERMRLKLSSDIHDIVGSKLSELYFMAEIGKAELYEDIRLLKSESKFRVLKIDDVVDDQMDIDELAKYGFENVYDKLDRITQVVSELTKDVSDVVWMINPNRDTLKDLVSRLIDTYKELLGRKGVFFEVKSDIAENIQVRVETRQNIYLILKEAITNGMKYSQCRYMLVMIKLSQGNFEITYFDDGIGFNPEHVIYGNGIENMKRRTMMLKGNISIQSSPNNGTTIRITFGAV